MTDEYNDLWVTDRPVLVTIVTELRAELSAAQAAQAQAERERDEARARRDFAREGEDNMRFLLNLWQRECDYYRNKCFVREAEIERQRRTIRALVVAARAMWRIVIDMDLDAPGMLRQSANRVRLYINHADRQAKE